ncbi:MAG: single-stranded-DNA-specific exonuclease RecJ [Halanaerobium sp.]
MNEIWKLSSYQENENSNYLEQLLSERGIISEEQKEIYLNSELKYLSDPFLLPEMNKAVKRIEKAVKNGEKILVYGDYDVDGITSTALLYRFFKNAFDLEIEYFLPDRIEDGYGLNLEALKKIIKSQVDLIITVDCGITAFKEADFLKKEGVDLIITDHHTPSDELPAASAVINHHLVKNENYFAADIAGVATAYKLAQALNSKIVEEMKAQLLPITALGTVADIAPLRNENRILVKNGLQLLKKDKVLGLKVLIEELGIDKNNVSAGQIGYIIAPPLNAAGRIHDAEEALKLLISEDKNLTVKIAKNLIKINKKRQSQEEKIYQAAENKIEKSNLEKEKSIILADSDWHSGIIGIVASRLLEKYNLPVILFAIDEKNNTAKGSARSISDLNIYQALKHCQSLLKNFGGHKAAAGLSIDVDQIDNFKNRFKEYLFQNLVEEDFLRKRKIDMNLRLSNLNKEFILSLEKFRPFGVANPAPKFLFKNINSSGCYQMGRENKHLKIHLENGIQAVAFNLGDQASALSTSQFDLIAQAEINRWQGNENIQLKVKDYRLCSEISTALLFEKEDYYFYDYRNTAAKNEKLQKLLASKVVKQAAVYINQKKEKNDYLKSNSKDYFFGSRYKFEAEFSHLIFYSLPFSLLQFNKIIRDFKNNNSGRKNKIILLFSELDVKYNAKIIKHLKQEEILANNENELDFKDSVRYNKLSRQMDKFIEFKELVFRENLFDLIANVSNFKEDKNES